MSETASDKCDQKENHQHFIKASDTWMLPQSLSHLSVEEKSMFDEFIRCISVQTAMIEVEVDEGTRCGTGFVQKIETVTDKDKPCPCEQFKASEGPGETQWGKVTLTTALHVLKEEADAAKCQARLFYDSDESGDQEKIIHGLESHSRDVAGDWCVLVCVTHDADLLRNLEDKLKQYWNLGRQLKEKHQTANDNLYVVVVSHPYGGPKSVSVGKAKVKDFAKEVREDQDWCTYSYDAVTSDGSSGAPVYVFGQWNDGFGYWFGHSHNHSGIDNYQCNSSTIGVDQHTA